jgi:5'(3')-deoxyribonucleotidase
LYWLRKNEFNYTDVLFNCGNKVDACKFKGVDFMVDDSPHNLKALHAGKIPYIVFDQTYNQDIYGEEFRAKTWNDMYNFFDFLGVDKK